MPLHIRSIPGFPGEADARGDRRFVFRAGLGSLDFIKALSCLFKGVRSRHSVHILHDDIKPSNGLLLTCDLEAALVPHALQSRANTWPACTGQPRSCIVIAKREVTMAQMAAKLPPGNDGKICSPQW
jgi:hypothetical protein